MGLKCKLEILEEKNAIKEFHGTFDGCIFIRCLDGDIRDKIYDKFEHEIICGFRGEDSYAYNDNYLCSKYYSNDILIIAEKNKIKEYVLNQIGDDEVTYVKVDRIQRFRHWLEKELNLETEEAEFHRMRTVQIDIRDKRKEKAINLIDELF